MDASAYLQKQGWRGVGHSLDHTNRGIKKPLLVSKKVDVLGVGLNKHAAVSDQWWMRAFDQGLKSLGSGQQSVLASVQKHGVNRGGLYARFVQGENNPGSIGQSLQGSEDSASSGITTPVDTLTEVNAKMDTSVLAGDTAEQSSGRRSEKGHRSGKRKRAEADSDKKARRKTDRQESTAEEGLHDDKHALANGAQGVEAHQQVEGDMQDDPTPQHRMTVENGGSIQTTKFEENSIPPKLLADYRKKAKRKGMELEAYIKHREHKKATKRAGTLDTLAEPEVHTPTANGDEHATTQLEQPSIEVANEEHVNSDPPHDLGFVVDTTGDEQLVSAPKPSEATNPTITTKSDGTLTWASDVPVPLDPQVWAGHKVKELPKIVRKARQQWMRNEREKKRARREERLRAEGKNLRAKGMKKKNRNQIKAEAREDFVLKLLTESRKAMHGGSTSGMLTVDGIADVPIVKLDSKSGKYSRAEMSSARTVARRKMRALKREERAAKGKSKGYKKREREAKKAAAEAETQGS